MEITIFSKNVKSKDGRVFPVYFTRLTNKQGEVLSCTVKFLECAVPEKLPANIVLEHDMCSLSTKQRVDKSGNVFIARTLWVKDWNKGSPFVDHSMDDFF